MFSYRMQIARMWREFDMRPISELPADIITNATPESLMWDAFSWGMLDPGQMSVIDTAPMRLIKDLYREWQSDSGVTVFEIQELLDCIEEHSAPLEYDLMAKGLRLRHCPSPEFNWRDLWVFITYMDLDSALVRAASPERAGWTKTAMLLADIADGTDWLVWSKTISAAEGGSPPNRRVRPGVLPPEIRAGSKVPPMTLSRVKEHAAEVMPERQETEMEHFRRLQAVFR